MAGHQYDRRWVPALGQLAGDLEAVKIGKLNVEHHHIRPQPPNRVPEPTTRRPPHPPPRTPPAAAAHGPTPGRERGHRRSARSWPRADRRTGRTRIASGLPLVPISHPAAPPHAQRRRCGRAAGQLPDLRRLRRDVHRHRTSRRASELRTVSVLLPLCRSTHPYSRQLVGERAVLEQQKALLRRVGVGAGGVEPPSSSVSGGSGQLGAPRAARGCSVLPQLKGRIT